MINWPRAAGKLAVVSIVGLVIEGCVLRDPWVELGNGYHFGAISWTSPCFLAYFHTRDPRPPSPWRYAPGELSLFNTETGAQKDYKSAEELKRAAREMHARPSAGKSMAHNVTAYAATEQFAIGQSADGYFLLNLNEDTIEKWPTHEEWARAVRARTPLDPQRLRDPKSWSVQHRHAGYWTLMGGCTGLGMAWIARPLFRGRAQA